MKRADVKRLSLKRAEQTDLTRAEVKRTDVTRAEQIGLKRAEVKRTDLKRTDAQLAGAGAANEKGTHVIVPNYYPGPPGREPLPLAKVLRECCCL